jgi:hypothetical protein
VNPAKEKLHASAPLLRFAFDSGIILDYGVAIFAAGPVDDLVWKRLAGAVLRS